jgi:hypothetical protein
MKGCAAALQAYHVVGDSIPGHQNQPTGARQLCPQQQHHTNTPTYPPTHPHPSGPTPPQHSQHCTSSQRAHIANVVSTCAWM